MQQFHYKPQGFIGNDKRTLRFVLLRFNYKIELFTVDFAYLPHFNYVTHNNRVVCDKQTMCTNWHLLFFFVGMQTKINGDSTIGNNHLLYKQGFQKNLSGGIFSYSDDGFILNKLVDDKERKLNKFYSNADYINDLQSIIMKFPALTVKK